MKDSPHHNPLRQLSPPTEPLPMEDRPRRPGTHLEEGAVGALSPQALRARLVLTVLLVDLELLHLPGNGAASQGSQNPQPSHSPLGGDARLPGPRLMSPRVWAPPPSQTPWLWPGSQGTAAQKLHLRAALVLAPLLETLGPCGWLWPQGTDRHRTGTDFVKDSAAHARGSGRPARIPQVGGVA